MTGPSFARTLTAASAPDREGTDFYPTPAAATHALLNYLDLPAGTRVWEPACGEGHLSRVLSERALIVYSTDLHPRGYGTPDMDFLKVGNPQTSQWIITNPPFTQAQAFIAHALTLGLPFAFLLKGQFWHAQRRMALFERHRPAAVLPLTWRPDFLNGAKGGSPTMEVVWTVWDAAPAERTVFQPLARPLVKP